MKAPLLLLLVLAASSSWVLGCNKHNVPLGGECERLEDCETTNFGCVKADGAAKGYCSTPCSIPPPGTQVIPGGKTCESAGMVCQKATTPHKTLGEAYCVKKP